MVATVTEASAQTLHVLVALIVTNSFASVCSDLETAQPAKFMYLTQENAQNEWREVQENKTHWQYNWVIVHTHSMTPVTRSRPGGRQPELLLRNLTEEIWLLSH